MISPLQVPYLLDMIISGVVKDLEWSTSLMFREIFHPRRELLPLLHVCKAWHSIAEHYLYETIYCGDNTEDEVHYDDRENVSKLYRKGRLGSDTAGHLFETLKECPRLAVLVKSLGFYIQVRSRNAFYHASDNWAQTAAVIINLCANVQHIELRGNWVFTQTAVFHALMDKPIETFKATGDHSCPARLLFKAIEKWPHLRRLAIRRLIKPQDDLEPIEKLAPNCVCPHLKELYFALERNLGNEDLQVLHTLCPNVKALTLDLDSSGNTSTVLALPSFLRASASSLERVEIISDIELTGNHSLLGSLSTLLTMKKLCLKVRKWDAYAICRLPNLERIELWWDHEQLTRFAACLEDPQKFPSLSYIIIQQKGNCETESEESLESVCRRRHIELSMNSRPAAPR